MKVTALHTPTLFAGDNLLGVIKTSMESLPEKSVLVVTSKVVALWENAIAPTPRNRDEKHQLIKKESEFYTEPISSKYNLSLTIRGGTIGVDAGIDESNVSEGFVLLPHDPYESAKHIWQFIRETYSLSHVGVIITDSISLPLKWGVVGRSIGHCGFEAVTSKVGEPDLFGRKMTMTKIAVAEALATSAVFAMGEVAESTPLCLIEDIPHITFLDTPPSEEARAALYIDPEDDVYAPMLTKAPWKKGERTV